MIADLLPKSLMRGSAARLIVFMVWTALALVEPARAQEGLAIGQWQSYLPHKIGRWVTQSDSLICYATTHGLLTIAKGEESVAFLSKVDGFTQADPVQIYYHKPDDVFVIAYGDASIDLWSPRGISTMTQIRNFENISGAKKINRVKPATDSTLYLATSYGISEINLEREEFRFSTFTGVNLNDVCRFQDTIFAATDEGIYFVALDGTNPADFNQWGFLGADRGFRADYTARHLDVFDGALYLSMDDSLFAYRSGQALEFVYADAQRNLSYLSPNDGVMLIGHSRCPDFSCNGTVTYLLADGTLGIISGECPGQPRYGLIDEAGKLWMADGFRSIRAVDQLDQDQCTIIRFDRPRSPNNFQMTVWENQLWMASGGLNQNLGNRFVFEGFASLIDGRWSIFNVDNYPALRGADTSFNDLLLDFIDVAVHPQTGEVYAASYMRGLAVWDGENMSVFNEDNSTLGRDPDFPSIKRVRTAGLAFDDQNNLWVTNTLSPRPLVMKTNEGEWYSFELPGAGRVYQIDVDGAGFKWMTAWQEGLYVFDEGELDNPTDDRARLFTEFNSDLPSNRVRCVKVDLDGDVWVGTSKGVAIFECGSAAFEDNCDVSPRLFDQDGFLAFLLETEDIFTIEVDGANRKWVGTGNGVFVLSPDGEEQIARFTKDNSPLFDNTIFDIAINPESGEVFIGTAKGILSLKGEATRGGQFHEAQVEVFPNPVRPDYDGPIAIRGLPRDAVVKITDINGQLVYETEALGGQAIWDGRDYNGRRVATGVYLIFSSSNSRYAGFDARSDAEVGKVVIIN